MKYHVSYKKSKASILMFGIFAIMLSTFFSMSCEPVGHADQYAINKTRKAINSISQKRVIKTFKNSDLITQRYFKKHNLL